MNLNPNREKLLARNSPGMHMRRLIRAMRGKISLPSIDDPLAECDMADNALAGYLPCPFCGSSRLSRSKGRTGDGNLFHDIKCDACNAKAGREIWNNRATENTDYKSVMELLQIFAEEADRWPENVLDSYRPRYAGPGTNYAGPGNEAAFAIGHLRRARKAITYGPSAPVFGWSEE